MQEIQPNKDRKVLCKMLFQDSIEGALEYFRDTSWIFEISTILYDRYLNELKSYIQSAPDNA